MYMSEMGIDCSHGFISKTDFIKYRQLVEMKCPLKRELDALHMSYLPSHLRFWALLKVLYEEVLVSRKKLSTVSVSEAVLHIDEVAFILHNTDVHFTKKEFYFAMLYRARFDKLMKHLGLKSLKGNYAVSSTHDHIDMLARAVVVPNMEGISFDDLTYVARASFLGWAMSLSRRPSSDSHVSVSRDGLTVYH
jgi:hypothetical protein